MTIWGLMSDFRLLTSILRPSGIALFILCGEAATFIPNSSFLIYAKLSSPIKGRYALRANPLILSPLIFFSFSCYNVKKV